MCASCRAVTVYIIFFHPFQTKRIERIVRKDTRAMLDV